MPANLVLQEYEYDVPLAISSKRGEDGRLFYMRIASALKEVDDRYDVVVIDCPPQLGYLTITALMASTGILITIHPQMLDIMSMSQFLMMLGGIMGPVAEAGPRCVCSGSDISSPVLSRLIFRKPRWSVHAVDVRAADAEEPCCEIHGHL